MNGIFKDQNEIIVTGCDSDEKILIKKFYELTQDATKEVVFTLLYDINGNPTGVSIKIQTATVTTTA